MEQLKKNLSRVSQSGLTVDEKLDALSNIKVMSPHRLLLTTPYI
jgi:hypothetical protein